VLTDISEERIASIFRQKKKEENPRARNQLEQVNVITTRRHIPEDGFLHSHRRENLKSYIPKPG
jgi:hypothetical protein